MKDKIKVIILKDEKVVFTNIRKQKLKAIDTQIKNSSELDSIKFDNKKYICQLNKFMVGDDEHTLITLYPYPSRLRKLTEGLYTSFSKKKINDYDETTKLLIKSRAIKKLSNIISLKSFEKMSIVVCDIDNFKSINAEYGFLAGDYILTELGVFIKSNIREGDFGGIFEGQKFFLVLNNCDADVAQKRMENLRYVIEKQYFIYRNNEINITMSFGINSIEKNDIPEKCECEDVVNSIIKSAEKALNKSKTNGKNKVSIYKK